MTNDNSIFQRASSMLTGVIYKQVHKYPTFIHLESFFNDAWYNYLVPLVGPEKFDWAHAKEVVIQEQKRGFNVSFYINKSLMLQYIPYLFKDNFEEQGNEVYMFKNINSATTKFTGKFTEVSENNLEKFIEMSKSCFGGWVNTDAYARHIFEIGKKKSSDKIIKNYLYYVDENPVGFGGIIISKSEGLSYLHNTGVLEPFRKRGYYTDLVNFRCNLSLEHGVDEVFALVEEEGGSYIAEKKLGFNPIDIYYLYNWQKQSHI